jgi:hypothetical protein
VTSPADPGRLDVPSDLLAQMPQPGDGPDYHADLAFWKERVPSYWPNWAGVLVLEPIEGLDPGIAPWVELLRAHRVETYESCQGGADPERPERGHAYAEPTIAFFGGPSAGFHAYAVAVQHALPVSCIRRVWKHDDHELCGPCWEMVFRRQATAEDARDVRGVLAFERTDGRVSS